jgi:hypothetical protein
LKNTILNRLSNLQADTFEGWLVDRVRVPSEKENTANP